MCSAGYEGATEGIFPVVRDNPTSVIPRPRNGFGKGRDTSRIIFCRYKYRKRNFACVFNKVFNFGFFPFAIVKIFLKNLVSLHHNSYND